MADQSEYSLYSSADASSSTENVAPGNNPWWGLFPQADPNQSRGESENTGFNRCAILLIILLILVAGILFSVTAYTVLSPANKDDDGGNSPHNTQPYFFPSPRDPPPSKRSTTPPPKPVDISYQRKELSGLICHTTYEKTLATKPNELCDFAIVDIRTKEPFVAQPGDFGATVPFDPEKIEPLFAHLWNHYVTGVILSHDGGVLRQTSRATLPQILRGLRQNIVDNNAHGVGLGWPVLHDTDLALIYPQIKFLSDELAEYHGLLHYEEYQGSSSELKKFIVEIGRLASVTLIYQISRRTSLFTHPYFDNFYLNRISEKPLRDIIDEEVVQPIMNAGGKPVRVAIGMSLKARSCPINSVYDGKKPVNCKEIPLNTSQLCNLSSAVIQGSYFSFVTRRYKVGDPDFTTEDIFFETQQTVSRKAYLILQQLKNANVKNLAFALRDHDLDLQINITNCSIYEHGIINMTRAEIVKLL